MNLNDYFDPVELNWNPHYSINKNDALGSSIFIHTSENKIENIEDYNIALVGVLGCDNKIDENIKGLTKIREHLYNLSLFQKKVKICDLGNLKKGNTSNDHSVGLRDVIVELLTLQIIPVIIGASEEIIYPNYLAYQKLDKKINMVDVDSRINISENREREYKSALWKILVEDNDSLFFYTNIGYQSHFVNSKITKYITDHLHFCYRLGYIRNNLKEVESIFRDADLIGLNISSVRQSDAFGQERPSPNGYYGEEICQLARYAGLSQKLSSFGIYDYTINSDINAQTAGLMAQIIWYFVDGYIHRIDENPLDSNADCKKYIVNLDNLKHEIVFYRSEKTNRYWVEVPRAKGKLQNSMLMACTYEDYIEAGNGDVPERWLKAFQKLND